MLSFFQHSPDGVVGASPIVYWTATVLFVLTFAAIISERIHKTKVTLFAAAVTIVLPILTQEEAFHSTQFGVDYNVIFLLVSMMILVNVLSKTGIFEWAAIKMAKVAKGQPLSIMSRFVLLTAVASAFLDNVTTVLLLAPVTLLIADELDIDPIPFLIAEALASNIGGAATLIGDPPNILIASRANLSFMDFIAHIAPAVVVMMCAFLVIIWALYSKRLSVAEDKRQRILAMDERRMIKDRPLAIKSLVVLGLTLIGFTLHGALGLEPATVALLGAATLLIITRGSPRSVLAEVEWPTIFFFIGLFIVVGGIVKVGLIRDLSHLIIGATEPSRGDMTTTATVMLWTSGVLSAVVDNIPYTATMSPLVLDMASSVFHDGAVDPANLPDSTLHDPVLQPVWWALALGACLGGNGSPIGASANVVVLGIAERAGARISFGRFVRLGIPVTLITLAIGQAYLWLRYY